MAINHSVPSTTRQPGTFHEFDLVSGAVGLVPLDRRVLAVAVMSSGGSATVDLPTQIFDEQEADLLFGVGSEAALMARKGLETARLKGASPQIWVAGIADPAGTAATYTITVSAGTAAVAGDVVFRIAGHTIRAGVSAGDDEDAVAAAINTAVDEFIATNSNLPVTSGVALGVVTLTAVNTGVNGNDILVTVDDVGLIALTIVAADGVAGVGVATIATALSNSLSQRYLCKAIANHLAADVTAFVTHLDLAWDAAAKLWHFAIIGETGTIGTATTLQTPIDEDERFSLQSYEASPSLPGEIAMAQAVAIAVRDLPNFNWDGDPLPLFAPADSSVYTSTEIETALAGGVTPLKPNEARTETRTVRLITTKSQEGGSPFENAKDLAAINGLIFIADQLDIAFVQQFTGVNKSAQVIKRMRSVAYTVLKAAEELGVVQNVDALFDQLLVESDPIVPTRAVVAVPQSIIPNLHQIILVHTLFIE